MILSYTKKIVLFVVMSLFFVSCASMGTVHDKKKIEEIKKVAIVSVMVHDPDAKVEILNTKTDYESLYHYFLTKSLPKTTEPMTHFGNWEVVPATTVFRSPAYAKFAAFWKERVEAASGLMALSTKDYYTLSGKPKIFLQDNRDDAPGEVAKLCDALGVDALVSITFSWHTEEFRIMGVGSAKGCIKSSVEIVDRNGDKVLVTVPAFANQNKSEACSEGKVRVAGRVFTIDKEFVDLLISVTGESLTMLAERQYPPQ